MQAIARVNRVLLKDKPGGLIVDYIGIANLKKLCKNTTDDRKQAEYRCKWLLT